MEIFAMVEIVVYLFLGKVLGAAFIMDGNVCKAAQVIS